MTVERSRMVEWWPLVDVAKLDLREGDAVVIRTTVPISESQKQRIADDWKAAFPGTKAAVVAKDDIALVIERAMPEMRAEDLWARERDP